MKFKIVDIKHKTDSDADYETAVEIHQYTMNESRYILETTENVRLIFTEQDTTTSKSYMEPDFDHLDKTGETKYISYDIGTEHSTRTDIEFQVFSTLPRLSAKDYAILEKLEQNQYDKDITLTHIIDDYYAKSLESPSSDTLPPFVEYLNYQDGSVWNYRNIKLSKEDIEIITSSIQNAPDRIGGSIDINLSESAIQIIKALEQEQNDIRQKNGVTRIHNRCEKALCNIYQLTEKLVAQYEEEITNTFLNKPAALKM